MAKLIKGINDLASTDPDLISEWDYEKNGDLKPKDILYKSEEKVWWKCSEGHSWKSSVYHRSMYDLMNYIQEQKKENAVDLTPLIRNAKVNVSCPYCTEKSLVKDFDIGWYEGYSDMYGLIPNLKRGVNDLQTVRPDLSSDWDFNKNDKKPEDVFVNSRDVVWWRCDWNHSYKAKILDRVKKKPKKCPICNNRYRLERFVGKFLGKYGYDFKSQIHFDDLIDVELLSYDFGVYKDDKLIALIECQGKQHYEAVNFFGGEAQFERQKKHDEMKKEYAIKRDIPLIEVPYWIKNYEQAENFLKDKL